MKIPAYQEKTKEAPKADTYQGVICGVFNVGFQWDLNHTKRTEKWLVAIELDVRDSAGKRFVVCTKTFALSLHEKAFLPTLIKAALPEEAWLKAQSGELDTDDLIGRNVIVQTIVDNGGYAKIQGIVKSRDQSLKLETAEDFVPPLVSYYRGLADNNLNDF